MPRQPDNPSVLSTPAQPGQIKDGRAGRVHAKAAHHPQYHDPDQHPMATPNQHLTQDSRYFNPRYLLQESPSVNARKNQDVIGSPAAASGGRESSANSTIPLQRDSPESTFRYFRLSSWRFNGVPGFVCSIACFAIVSTESRSSVRLYSAHAMT